MNTNKVSLTQLILEKLNETGSLMLDAILPRNRVEGRMWRQLLGLSSSHDFSPSTFSTILTRLKQQGLVVKSGNHRRSVWALTKKGKKVLLQSSLLEMPKPDGVPRLVMFDIPEKERSKRRWLRIELLAYNFKSLQKSVWLGFNPLPEKFIKSIYDLKLQNKVHIVTIHQTGTLLEL